MDNEQNERLLFDQLLGELRLIDLFAEWHTQTSYSFERMNGRKLTQFPCDLALVDA